MALSPRLSIITRVLSEITRIPLNDPALLRCFLSAVTPCTMLMLAARGAPGPMHDLRQMPPDVIAEIERKYLNINLKLSLNWI